MENKVTIINIFLLIGFIIGITLNNIYNIPVATLTMIIFVLLGVFANWLLYRKKHIIKPTGTISCINSGRKPDGTEVPGVYTHNGIEPIFQRNYSRTWRTSNANKQNKS
jgi:hypothetical protein